MMDKVTTLTIIEIVSGKEFPKNFYRFCNKLLDNQLETKTRKITFWMG